MPLLETAYFGNMDYLEESIFDFPFGLPAFEQEKRFVFIETPQHTPLVFLQSLRQPSLCFLALPVLKIDSGYRLAVSREDRVSLGLDPEQEVQLGCRILALSLISLGDGSSPTANLMAPIVVNVENRRALQAIRVDRVYSHQHPVSPVPRSERAC
jgi:flagellar assembly factor FliW